MAMTRRHFIKASAASAASAVVSALPGSTFGVVGASLASLPVHSVLAATELSVGRNQLTVLSDGHLVLPRNFVIPREVPASEVAEFFAKHPLDASYEPACNVALWRSDDRLILFDVGAGPNFMASAGRLLSSLDDVAVDVSDITDVVFTHAHPDHLWGLVDDFDELTFPDAEFHINEVEWDFWSSDDTLAKLPESRKAFAVGAKNRFSYLDDRIKHFRYGMEVLPGVEAVNTQGHTPGHTSFALHSGSESILIGGDAITHSVISFEKTAWASDSDHNPQLAMKSRAALLDRLAQDKMRLLGFHLPYPGIGSTERNDGAYRYVAEL